MVQDYKISESKFFVAQWFQQPGPVLVRTTKEEKYGRMLADCYREGAPSCWNGGWRGRTPPEARGC